MTAGTSNKAHPPTHTPYTHYRCLYIVVSHTLTETYTGEQMKYSCTDRKTIWILPHYHFFSFIFSWKPLCHRSIRLFIPYLKIPLSSPLSTPLSAPAHRHPPRPPPHPSARHSSVCAVILDALEGEQHRITP